MTCKTHPHRLFFLGLSDPASLYDCAYGFFARAAVGGATAADAGAKSILERLATSCCSERRFWSSAFEKESGGGREVRMCGCGRSRERWGLDIGKCARESVRDGKSRGVLRTPNRGMSGHVGAKESRRWTSDVGHRTLDMRFGHPYSQ